MTRRKNQALTRGTHVTRRTEPNPLRGPKRCEICGTTKGHLHGLIDAGWCNDCGRNGSSKVLSTT